MKRRPLSIRTTLWLTVSLLALMIFLLVGQEVWKQWQQLQKIEQLQEATLISDKLFVATGALSDERDVAFALLHAPDKEDISDLQLRLKDNRRNTDTAFAEALAAMNRYDFPELASLRQTVETHLAAIKSFRSEIDRTDRQPILAGRWYDETTGLSSETENLWLTFIRHFTDINPVVTQHLRYKHFLLIISDYTARQRAMTSKLLVENADPTPEETAEWLHWQGALELAWKTTYLLAEQSGLYADVEPSFKDAESHYQTMQDMTHGLFIPGGRHGIAYPVSAGLWLELSDEAADSLNALKDASWKAKHAYLDSLETQGKKVIALQFFVLALAFMLCGFCFRIISRRVLGPIEAMIAALSDAVQGKPVSFAPQAHQQDEIGKLGNVLHIFQQNVEAIKLATLQMKNSEERYRALVEAGSNVVWGWKEGHTDAMAPLMRWWEEVTGQPGEEITTFGWLDVVHSDDREHTKEIWGNAVQNAINFEVECRIRKRDGSGYLYVCIRGVARKHPDGTLHEFVGTLTDITARKKAENDLLAYTHALERSNKELDDFAYIASHDLKEPLRGIHNHSRFLLEDNKDKLEPESGDRLGRLVYLSQRMERLVNDLLYFSRLGRQELAIQSSDLNEVIHDIESTLDLFLKERSARIAVPKPLPTITCDKPRITEVFRNLITNAVKYNDKPERIVEIGFLPEGSDAEGAKVSSIFYVRDNGKGIEKEFYNDIFRIFKRLQKADDSPEEGTGVGLTFVKKIIERHGGKIWLESIVGQGTVFYFTLGGAQANDISKAA